MILLAQILQNVYSPCRHIWTAQARLPTHFSCCSCLITMNRTGPLLRKSGCASSSQLHNQREILQTMRTDVVSNFPPSWWIGTLVMLTKLDCQRAFTLILLVCRPLDQAYRHGNEVGRVRERKRERWSRHGLASVQHTHTHTHAHNLKYTNTARESSKVCPDGILLRCTALFKGLIDSQNTVRSTKGHHQLQKQPGQWSNRCQEMKRFLRHN